MPRPIQTQIRPMLPSDIETATEAIVRADWGDRRTWFEFATTQPECRPVVAEQAGRIVGTGVGTANGSVGWVGTIWVEPSSRRRGLGRALTDAVIDGLADSGCATLVLVATPDGLPLYERLGFEVQARYQILEAPGLDPATTAADPDIRPFEASDLPAILELDRQATGEDRGHAIRRFATAASARVLAVGGRVVAFVVRAPWGGGATIAPDPKTALRLLDARRRASGVGGRVRVGVLDSNTEALAALTAAGLAPIWSAPRLIRGLPLDWQPERIWGQFNHAMG